VDIILGQFIGLGDRCSVTSVRCPEKDIKTMVYGLWSIENIYRRVSMNVSLLVCVIVSLCHRVIAPR